MSEIVHIISLGAGVQSSCMALMAAKGQIDPMPTAAIFADTGDEPASVYRWLEYLTPLLPFPVVKVQKGRLSEAVLQMRTTKDGRRFNKTKIPFHTLSETGDVGMVRHRACTADYKITPILTTVRRLANIKRGQKEVGVIQWIGISLDEVVRMKEAREPWVSNRWPLVELGMKRHDCLAWMQRNGYPRPPRSSCVFCPYHSNREWRRLKDEEPEEFQKAVQFERNVQASKRSSQHFDSTPFLHRSCVPLDQVDLSTEEERGQLGLWGNECEGMCGV